MKKVSVIIPVYNAEKYIRRSIESVLNQSISNLELILVDDGSSDNSGKICDEYSLKDKRVKVIHKENGGAASARNVGIKCATGEYIAFCDGDDFLLENMYEEMVNVLEKNGLKTISCLSNTLNEDGKVTALGNKDKALKIFSAEEYIKQILLHKADVSLCTRITKREYIKDLIIPEGRRVEDFYFTIRLLCNTNGTAIYNFPYYQYTVNSQSVTHSANATIYLDGLYFLDKTKEILDANVYGREQEYFTFKMLYMLFLSTDKQFSSKYKYPLVYYKSYIRKNIIKIFKDEHLYLKEKVVLFISSVSLRIAKLLYLFKNIGENK